MDGIEIRNLSRVVGGRGILKDVNISLPAGRIVGLLGPNGTGKTTLLKVLAGLTTDYHGTVRIDGVCPGVDTKSFVSYLPDRTFLPAWMRTSDAVSYFKDFFADFDPAKANELLRYFRMEEQLRVRDMSKGMQEKLQIALILSRKAKVFLLDEPLAGVDPVTRNVILDRILKEYSEDAVTIFATQLIDEVERIFDRVIFLEDGKIRLDEDVETIRENYGKSVGELFGEVYACSANF